MASIRVSEDKCVGCGLCTGSCPFNAIRIEDKKAVITENCTLCGACISACKFKALEQERDEAGVATESIDISAFQGVWVFAEQYEGRIKNVAFELLGAAGYWLCS